MALAGRFLRNLARIVPLFPRARYFPPGCSAFVWFATRSHCVVLCFVHTNTRKQGQGHPTSHRNLHPGHCFLAARAGCLHGSLISLGCEKQGANPRGERLLHVAAFRHPRHPPPARNGLPLRAAPGLYYGTCSDTHTLHGLVLQCDGGQPLTPAAEGCGGCGGRLL